MNDSALAVRPAPGRDDGATGTLSDYPAALIEVTLDRVVASATFRRSLRHRQFLVHLVRSALAGRHDRLKEVIIGLEVFGRALPEYDPRRDPIVRVEAGRIRDKLDRYYEGEGADEPFQIVIPIGNYQPQFVRRKFVADTAQRATSLAVLPFANLGGDPDDGAFSLGLADQLIDTLGRVPGLRVVARLSALKARDGGHDLRSVGKLLGVEHVVEGSLQRSGSRVRCIAQLSRARDGMRVWSQRFDHDGDREEDLFDFQDTIADAVLGAVSALQPSPAYDERSAKALINLRPAGTGNREARDLFERARYMSQQRSIAGYEKAIELLERAVVLDPSFAQAHSHLGVARVNLTATATEPTYPAFHRVKQAAMRALELDPLDAEARALLAIIAYRIDYAWEAAEPMFHEALRLSPSSSIAHAAYAWGLVFNGRFDEAMQHTRLAQDLDPLNIGLRASNAAVAKYARRHDVAIREFEAVLELEPTHLFSTVQLGITDLLVGRYDAARILFDNACRDHPLHPSPQFCRVGVLGLLGETARAKDELGALLVRLGARHYSRFNLAMARVCIGEIDGAFESLDDAARTRDLLFVSLQTHGLFDPHRNDPRYGSLLSRYGIARIVPR